MGLMANPRNAASAGVKLIIGVGFPGQRIPRPVIRPNSLAQRAVRLRSPELLDPGVFVGRYALLRQLPTNPVGFFRHNNPATHAEGCQCRRTATQATPENDDIGFCGGIRYKMPEQPGRAGREQGEAFEEGSAVHG